MLAQTSLDLESIQAQVKTIFSNKMHLKRQHSLADAALGLLNSDSLRLHSLGEGLALCKGLNKKHTTKQIDRLLSNKKLSIWDIAEQWVPYIIGHRKEIYVAMDWTSFWEDAQQTICINILTSHGRAIPLLWQSVERKGLKNNQEHYEDQLLSRLKTVLPDDVKVTVIADRGFASYRFFEFIEQALGFNYLIRIKSSTTIISQKGTTKKVKDWLRPDGRALNIKQAKITQDEYPVEQVIVTRDKQMKEAWYLVSNCQDKKTRELINLYAKRWKIEPYFRDVKDQRFGFGLSATHIKSSARRDRLLLIVALAYVLFTLLGAVGEQLGFDKKLKVNTVKTRTHSLIRQGMFYYDFFRHFTPEEKENLMLAFDEILIQRALWTDILCVA